MSTDFQNPRASARGAVKDKQQPAQFDWATELSDVQGRVTLSEQEAHEIGARLRSLGAKLNAYEDLGDTADDVQLLRMGYAAARLEIESLRAALTTAQAEGWRLVPVEPTQEMLDAVVTTMDDALLGKEAEKQYREDWAAMLAAAPTSAEGVEHG